MGDVLPGKQPDPRFGVPTGPGEGYSFGVGPPVRRDSAPSCSGFGSPSPDPFPLMGAGSGAIGSGSVAVLSGAASSGGPATTLVADGSGTLKT